MHFITVKFSGLLYSGIQAEVCIKLFRGGKEVKIAHLRYQHNGAEEADTP